MARRALQPCARPGCSALVAEGTRCPPHQAAHEASSAGQRRSYDDRRGSPAARGYDSEWRRVKDAYRARHPMCEVPGCGRPTYDVDHVRELRDGGARLDPGNLKALCRSHHVRKTAARRRERT
jgi:5-methylcytosine-specific restriction enzyme A